MQDSHFLARRRRVEPGEDASRSQRRRQVVTDDVREEDDYRPSQSVTNADVPEAWHVGASAAEQLQQHVLDFFRKLVRFVENQHRGIEVHFRAIEGRKSLTEDQIFAQELFGLSLTERSSRSQL